jgi:hypothetical protein
MPTSPFSHIVSMIRFLTRMLPSSILDIGVGNGKLGFIARDLLDVMLGERFRKEDWEVRIDGIEISPRYIQDHQKSVYDNIYIGDAFDVIDTLGRYDMVILGDVLEHFEKKRALKFLDKCVEHSNKSLAIFIPLGKKWIQSDIYGNPYEKHLSFWEREEFIPFICDQELFAFPNVGFYGAFLINKEDYIDFKIADLSKHRRLPLENKLRAKYLLNRVNISNIALSGYTKYVANMEHLQYFLDDNFKEHYKLIAYISSLFNDATIFDVGTNLGYSALALSYNSTNIIVSYDIVKSRELYHSEELHNIDFRIGDVLQDKRLLQAQLIMLDTFHDGVFEKKFYEFLKKEKYKGLLFLDDIHLNEPMKKFWDSISEPKEDLTDVGHWSGSGLVDFGLV